MRPIKSGDLEGIWANFNEVVAEREYLPVMTPVLTKYEREAWYEDLKLRGELCVVAEVASRESRPVSSLGTPPASHHVAGQCTIENSEWEAAAHVGLLGVIVRSDYRDVGLGGQLVRYALENAALAGKKKINLAVFATNARALALYEKLGFRRVGLRRDQYKVGPGRYVDEVLMDYDYDASDLDCESNATRSET